MATNCSSCGCNNLTCGCKNSFLTTPPPCPTPIDCPEAQSCSETQEAKCVIYTGDDILCNQDIVVSTGDTVETALESIVTYLCENTPNGVIVSEGVNIDVTSVTVGDVTTYTVNGLNTIVAAGTGVDVSAVTVGSTTTYTVSTEVVPLRKFVKEHTFPDALSTDIFILQGELQDCNMPGVDSPCGLEGLPTDLIIKGYFFNPDINYWVEFTHQDATTVNIDNSGSIYISASLVPAPVFPPGGINARIVIIG